MLISPDTFFFIYSFPHWGTCPKPEVMQKGNANKQTNKQTLGFGKFLKFKVESVTVVV